MANGEQGVACSLPYSLFVICHSPLTVMPVSRICRLTLTNFRSYRAASLQVAAGPVVLTGPNGAGKTNLIEDRDAKDALYVLMPMRV